jgi:hypothetical protein
MNGVELLRVMPTRMITGEVSEDVVAVAAESEVDSYLPFRRSL